MSVQMASAVGRQPEEESSRGRTDLNVVADVNSSYGVVAHVGDGEVPHGRQGSTPAEEHNRVDDGVDDKRADERTEDPFPRLFESDADEQKAERQLNTGHAEIGNRNAQYLPFYGLDGRFLWEVEEVVSHAVMRLEIARYQEKRVPGLPHRQPSSTYR